MEHDYLSTREAAELLGESLRQLYGRIDAGEIRAWSFTSDEGMPVIRLKRADVEAFAEQLPNAGNGEAEERAGRVGGWLAFRRLSPAGNPVAKPPGYRGRAVGPDAPRD